MRRLPRRLLLEWLIPGGAIVVAVFLAVICSARLPDPVATGWSLSGVPGGPSSRTLELSLGVVVVAIAAAFTWTASRAPTVRIARSLVAFGHFAAVAWLGRLVRVVSGNLDAAHWSNTDATISIPAIIGAAVAGGAIGWAVSAHRQRDCPSA